MEYKRSNFGTVSRYYAGYYVLWYGTEGASQRKDGFVSRKEANAFLKSNGITICTSKEFNKKTRARG